MENKKLCHKTESSTFSPTPAPVATEREIYIAAGGHLRTTCHRGLFRSNLSTRAKSVDSFERKGTRLGMWREGLSQAEFSALQVALTRVIYHCVVWQPWKEITLNSDLSWRICRRLRCDKMKRWRSAWFILPDRCFHSMQEEKKTAPLRLSPGFCSFFWAKASWSMVKN